MSPAKNRMVRNANTLWVLLTVAPGLYLVIAAIVTWGGRGFARDQSVVLWLFLIFVIVSAAQIWLTVFTQTSETFMVSYGPIPRTFQIMVLGSVLSEAHSVYGLSLTLFSGSIFYAIGFSLVAWASLLWVRGRFKQNLAKLPDAQSSEQNVGD
jgi:hypothetical protein